MAPRSVMASGDCASSANAAAVAARAPVEIALLEQVPGAIDVRAQLVHAGVAARLVIWLFHADPASAANCVRSDGGLHCGRMMPCRLVPRKHARPPARARMALLVLVWALCGGCPSRFDPRAETLGRLQEVRAADPALDAAWREARGRYDAGDFEAARQGFAALRARSEAVASAASLWEARCQLALGDAAAARALVEPLAGAGPAASPPSSPPVSSSAPSPAPSGDDATLQARFLLGLSLARQGEAARSRELLLPLGASIVDGGRRRGAARRARRRRRRAGRHRRGLRRAGALPRRGAGGGACLGARSRGPARGRAARRPGACPLRRLGVRQPGARGARRSPWRRGWPIRPGRDRCARRRGALASASASRCGRGRRQRHRGRRCCCGRWAWCCRCRAGAACWASGRCAGRCWPPAPCRLHPPRRAPLHLPFSPVARRRRCWCATPDRVPSAPPPPSRSWPRPGWPSWSCRPIAPRRRRPRRVPRRWACLPSTCRSTRVPAAPAASACCGPTPRAPRRWPRVPCAQAPAASPPSTPKAPTGGAWPTPSWPPRRPRARPWWPSFTSKRRRPPSSLLQRSWPSCPPTPSSSPRRRRSWS